jgi:hypothetical protein
MLASCNVNALVKLSVIPIFYLLVIPVRAGTQEEAKVVEQPSAQTTEPWQITVGGPGWLAGVTGLTGFHGVNSNVDVGVGQILKHINVVYSFGGEVRKGRFGVLGDLLYLNAQAGTGDSNQYSKHPANKSIRSKPDQTWLQPANSHPTKCRG